MNQAQITNKYHIIVVRPHCSEFVADYMVNHAAGIAVAYSAPRRHICLKVVENNYCASKRGMVMLLS